MNSDKLETFHIRSQEIKEQSEGDTSDDKPENEALEAEEDFDTAFDILAPQNQTPKKVKG